jgi:hypothetical protein
MNDLKNLTSLVHLILEHYPQTRNCDGLLWLKVLEHQAHEKQIDLRMLSVPSFLPRIKELGFSPFESVRRSRQKLQATYPHLAASDSVESFRAENERTYREYARGEV